jgi:CheY-like chemotaxis protein
MATNESDDRLQLLRVRYAGSLAAKRDALANAWRDFLDASADPVRRRELTAQVHRLCGSAAAYGYVELGERACVADRLLGGPPPTPVPAVLDAPLQAVIDALDRAIASAQATPLRRDAATLRVLLVEDDTAHAMLMASQLEAHGCEVRIESGSDDLWQALALWPCHAVVLGYRLRGKSAVEIVAMLRREPAFARVAVLCCSVEHATQIRGAGIEVGCDAVVAQQDGVERLFEAIRACAGRVEHGDAGSTPRT